MTIESYELKNKQKRYMFQLYIGVDELTGKEIRTRRRGFKTQKEARLALARLSIEIENGTYKKKSAEIYQDVYDLWIKHYEKTVEESTFVKTAGIFRNHILPAMGQYKIDKIDVGVCQRHVDEWATKLKNFRIVRSYAAKVMDFAIKRGFIKTDPFALVEMPKNLKKNRIGEKPALKFYNREQLLEFLSCLENESNHKAYAIFRLLAYSGMRKGEALALTWDDINFKDHVISINKALSKGIDNRLYVKPPKTGDSRKIKMDEKTMEILAWWKNKQKEDFHSLDLETTPRQLVFSNERNEFLQPTKTRKWIIHVQEKYNLQKITTHGLRHTHCSLLFEAGVGLKEVQDRLGHTDSKTTLDIYTHLTKKAKANAIQKFEEYINF